MNRVLFTTILSLILSLGCSSDDSSTVPEPGGDADVSERDMASVDGGDEADLGEEADLSNDPDAEIGCTFEAGPEESYPDPQIYTPKWAFLPWISKDISDRDDTYAFVDGFIDRDIPVGVVVLDSPWETHYNTFVPNPDRYPDFEDMIGDMRDRDVRVVLWITQMVNERSFDAESGGDTYDGSSPNFDEGQRCDFYVEGGETYFWWKGFGAAVDFFNPDAMQWWHRQQDALLDMGIAGWKLDFGESYIEADPMQTAAGARSLQEYSEAYYQDFYAYGASKLGTDEFVTMVRGWDVSYDHEPRFYARPEHAPVVWMGDNRRDWIGLIDALDHTFRSAQAGYVVVGSDLGGYLDVDDVNLLERVPFDQENFARWIAVSALSPFMQLHGRANLEPWSLPERAEETVEIYRYWAKIHTALIPFWYSRAQEAYLNGAEPIVRPVGATPADWEDDWRYMLGDAFLVAPVLDATGARDVELPSGRWYDWWSLNSPALEGESTLEDYDVAEQIKIPLFVKQGAIVPVDVLDDTLPVLGGGDQVGERTILAWPAEGETAFTLHHEPGSTTEISLERGRIELSDVDQATWLMIHTAVVSEVRVNSVSLGAQVPRADLSDQAESWYYDTDAGRLIVRLESGASTRVEWTPEEL